ncbi:hypothetical protein GSI_05114 [Ganoderma sinense ZZ0214-1]|uniref:Uncharacterized protein n=1 Tax=Ganoderma sinense ZZ0214-1 TaxID=1077348 RepID=A0A2G8SGW2_9APHY|nr:hypothetical protein GSI_05114 [Ganoderma sinense ZZ0214-1]
MFLTFNDFARTLHAFTRLQVLNCGDVDWITLGVLLPPFMTSAGATRRNGKFLPVLEKLTVRLIGRHGAERLLTSLALSASLRTLTVFLSTIGNLPQMYSSVNEPVDPATGMSDGLDLSLFPRLSDLIVLDIVPQSLRSAQRALLSALHELLASWSDDPPSRSLTLEIKPTPSPYSTEGGRFYTKQNYISFLEALGRTVEEACTHRRGSSIPALHARLEIPQDATTTLEELEREAGPQFPMTLKAGKLTVEAHTSGERYPCSPQDASKATG